MDSVHSLVLQMFLLGFVKNYSENLFKKINTDFFKNYIPLGMIRVIKKNIF